MSETKTATINITNQTNPMGRSGTTTITVYNNLEVLVGDWLQRTKFNPSQEDAEELVKQVKLLKNNESYG